MLSGQCSACLLLSRSLHFVPLSATSIEMTLIITTRLSRIFGKKTSVIKKHVLVYVFSIELGFVWTGSSLGSVFELVFVFFELSADLVSGDADGVVKVFFFADGS